MIRSATRHSVVEKAVRICCTAILHRTSSSSSSYSTATTSTGLKMRAPGMPTQRATFMQSNDKDVSVCVFNFKFRDDAYDVKKVVNLVTPMAESGELFMTKLYNHIFNLYYRSAAKRVQVESRAHTASLMPSLSGDGAVQNEKMASLDVESSNVAQTAGDVNKSPASLAQVIDKIDVPAIDIVFTNDLSHEVIDVSALRSLGELLAIRHISVQIMRQTYEIDIDPPTCHSIYLHSFIMAGCHVYPQRLVLYFADQMKSTFEWYVSRDVYTVPEFTERPTKESMAEAQRRWRTTTWVHRHTGLSYLATDQDVGRYVQVRCVPVSPCGMRHGAQLQATSGCPVRAGPQRLPFVRRHMLAERLRRQPNAIRVMSYNILAEMYSDSTYARNVLHSQCPPHALRFDYRRQLLYRELAGFQADIICLQETDRKFYTSDLRILAANEDYGLNFAQKGGMPGSGGSEGEAVMWRKSKFDLVEDARHVISGCAAHVMPLVSQLQDDVDVEVNSSTPTAPCHPLASSVRTLLNVPTVVQLVVLRHKVAEEREAQYVVVANTHLHFKPHSDDVRLMQVATCMRLISDVYSRFAASAGDENVAVIFTGDFNSTPPFGVYEFMRLGYIGPSHADWSSSLLSSTSPDDKATADDEADAMQHDQQSRINGEALHHQFKMVSACGTPPFTNYTVGFADCLDYIFIQSDRLHVDGTVDLPSENELAAHRAIPNAVFPSDHIPLVVDLSWLSTARGD